jgi:hypothetical protein
VSHLLHDYVSRQLARYLRDRRVVVWFDPPGDFGPFLEELSDDPGQAIEHIDPDGVQASLARYRDSVYELGARIEPLVSVDEPEPLVIYLAGVEQTRESPLKELELGGDSWTPQLRHLARYALRTQFTDGVIDELLRPENVGYTDIAAATAGGGGEPPSMLKTILAGGTSEAQLATWLADPALDTSIEEKGARGELRKLVRSRIDLDLPEADNLSKWRAITARAVLAVEFRSDLAGEAPRELEAIPEVATDAIDRARSIASELRRTHADQYPAIADQAENELGLGAAEIDPLALGAIDTFRFEERRLLDRCGELVRDGQFEQVEGIAEQRRHSYWLSTNVERQAQWEAMRLAARLGKAADDVEADLKSRPTSPARWIDNYARHWQDLDRAQRKFEAWLPKLEHDPDERAVAAVRARYEEVTEALATGFVAALAAAGWDVEGPRRQTSVFDDLVRPDKGPVAYFLIDAMRYEMGSELTERLETHGEVSIEPAVGVLPSITPTGMAALMPAASSSYSVIESGAGLSATVEGSVLKDRSARTSHIKARVPATVDYELGKLLALPTRRLKKEIGGKNLVVVRSVDIDAIGEGGSHLARGVMDTVIDNIAQAVRKLAHVGIPRTVIASDHGHLFAAEERDDSMKIEAPGGDRVELHRRCWAGRGGATPPSCVRVSARDLGNDADFDFVFPSGTGVFKAGGDLAFHHGGPTLQELVIPVIRFQALAAPQSDAGSAELAVTEEPSTITNRIFSVKLSYVSLLGAGKPVRPILSSEGRQVGRVGMVLGAEEQDDESVVLQQGQEASIGFMLDDDSVESLRIVVLDPATDAELYRSPADIPVRLGVG